MRFTDLPLGGDDSNDIVALIVGDGLYDCMTCHRRTLLPRSVYLVIYLLVYEYGRSAGRCALKICKSPHIKMVFRIGHVLEDEIKVMSVSRFTCEVLYVTALEIIRAVDDSVNHAVIVSCGDIVGDNVTLMRIVQSVLTADIGH